MAVGWLCTQGVDVADTEKALTRPASDDAPFSALAFKIMTDPFVGTLTFCRIYSGEQLGVCLMLLSGQQACSGWRWQGAVAHGEHRGRGACCSAAA